MKGGEQSVPETTEDLLGCQSLSVVFAAGRTDEIVWLAEVRQVLGKSVVIGEAPLEFEEQVG